jgi:hypothetical protein
VKPNIITFKGVMQALGEFMADRQAMHRTPSLHDPGRDIPP